MGADFFRAVAAGDRDRVRALLDRDPALSGQPGPDGETACVSALFHGHPGLADELAARSAPLDIFAAAAFDETDRLAELLLADLAQARAWSADGWQALHLAARFGRGEAARALLDADAPVAEPSRNRLGWYPLHAAVAGRHNELVWLLIASDADVDAREPDGATALHVAAANADLDSISALLAAGADRSAADREGRTPADLSTDDEIERLLRDAAS
ncbi:MAG: putative ankyrin [Frankiales bacterium]|nr:putative ankyrin [Frankiales bacterium]